jgi:Ca2+-binding RTX toxin-like protein
MAKITGKNNNGERLDGTKESDEIRLLDGDDTCVADLGDDTVYGGGGNDTIYARYSETNTNVDDGNDFFSGEGGNDFIYGGTGNDTLDGGDGADYLDGGDGNDSLTGGIGNDTLWSGTGNDKIDGGLGDDKLYGEAGNDTLDGGLGDDKLYGFAGNDTLDGGDGADYLDGDDGDDSLTGGLGNDDLIGGVGNDTLDSGVGNDTLAGGSGIDLMYGGDGNDAFYAGSGNDKVWGGAGNDTFSTYTGQTEDGDDIYYGEAGDDKLYGFAGNDTLDGGDGNDNLYGGDGNDSLTGGISNDTLDGGSGIDLMYGGDGNDAFYAGSGNDKVWGGAGNDDIWAIYSGELDDGDDTFYGEDGDDKLYGFAGNDTLDGGDGIDELTGGNGNDSLSGGLGNDTLSGGAGIDLIYGGDGNDYIQAGSGNDKVWGGAGNDDIWAIYSGELNDGDDTFYGEGGDDNLYGFAGNDTLDGGDGNDLLEGGDGNDTLEGGTGKDTINGGAGTDLAIYLKASSSYIIQIDGPSVIVTDKLTNEKEILSSIEKLSFAGVVSDISVFGKVSVDFNTLTVPEKKIILEDQYKALIYEGTKKWSGTNFTYSFAQTQLYSDLSNYSYVPTGETYKFQLIGSYLQNVTRETFDFLSAVLPLTFTETANTLSATFKFGSHNMSAGGYAQVPTYSDSGQIEISTKHSADKLGQFGVSTVIHELGHSLGLDHTSSRGDSTAGSEGGGDDVPSLPDYLDRTTLSIMSYAKVRIDDSYLASYSALDVRALFALYGKRESTEATTFKLYFDSSLPTASKQSSLNKIQIGQWDIYGYAPFMIVDNGGVDTVDVSEWKGGVKVDLSGWGIGPVEGSVQDWSFNSIANGTLYSGDIPGSPVVTIYPDSIIEKVLGSAEADIIIGYTAAETLDGGAGNDQINGGGGDDSIFGGIGNDILFGGEGDDQIEGGAGNDVIDGGSENDTLLVSGLSNNYLVLYDDSTKSYSIEAKSGIDGKDTIKNVEFIKFSDKTQALQISDVTPPTISISSNSNNLNGSQSALVTFTLSEISTNFAFSDVTVSGGVLSNFTGSGASYTALFTPTANSTTNGTVSVASGVFTDTAGNVNADGSDANNTITLAVDTVVPTIALSSSKNSLIAGDTTTLNFTLSEASTTFAASDVNVSGGVLSNFTGSGASYTALFTPTANSTTNGTVSVASGVFADTAGNVNADGLDVNNYVTMTINTVPADTTAPTITVATSATSLSALQTAAITFTLSEASSNFFASDVSVSGGTISNFSGGGSTYKALFTPIANSTANGVVSIASGVFTDTAGNANADGLDTNNTITLSIDTVVPTIALSAAKSSVIAGDTTTLTFTLSEASTSFVASDVAVTGGALSNFTGSGTTYTALFTPTANSTTSGTVSVASGVFADAVGNANADGLDANNTITLAVDTLLPTIAVSSNKSSLQGGDSATLTFSLSEPSTTFVASDVTVSGGSLSNFTGSGTSYTATFTLVADSAVTGTVNIANGVFADAAGNKNVDGSDANNTVNFSLIPTITNEIHTLSVIVDKYVLGADAVLLKGLKESMTFTNGAMTKHIVEYSGLTFDYNQIDSLLTTVTRDGEFTAEFTKEINDYLKTELNISYLSAVALVGLVSIDGVILSVAGADGSFVS